MKYCIEDGGIDHSQYWPGVSAYGTDWDEAYTGIGSTLREAIDDVLEISAQSGVYIESMSTIPDGELHGFTTEQLDSPLHDPTDECQEDNENCEHHHYAVLYVANESEPELIKVNRCW